MEQNLTGLASLLAEKTASDRRQVEQLMQSELQQLAESLRQQSSDALNGTVSDIRSEFRAHFAELRSHFSAQAQVTARELEKIEEQIKLIGDPVQALTEKLAGVSQQITNDLALPAKGIKTSLSQAQTAIKTQRDALEAEIVEQTKRLTWLMRWPILGTLAVCLVICGLTWGYWKLATPWNIEQMNSGKFRVMPGTWVTCTLGDGTKAPCQRIND